MSQSRRRFLNLSGMAVITATTGCDRLPGALLGDQFAKGTERPFHPPRSDTIDLITHHLNRLSFGPRPGDYDRVRALGATEEEAVEAYIEEQLHPERISDQVCERAVSRLPALAEPLGELFEYHDHVLLRELVHGTLLRAVYSQRQLYEVMIQFWSDHFNIDPSKGDCKWLKVWDDREVIRRYALGYLPTAPPPGLPEILRRFVPGAAPHAPRPAGKFSDLVRASALSPAMLWYLDGRENRKSLPDDLPNENYARELLELHTLGVHGGYRQNDVTEVARALTGWTVRGLRRSSLNFQVGKVEFNPDLHDDGPKTVLGKLIPAGGGADDLDRVLQIVSAHPSTASHVARKLCQRFIADPPPDSAVATAAQAFLKSQGGIRETLRALFHSEEFRAARGLKFKRPFNFVVSALRATDARVRRRPNPYDDGPIYEYLRRMGHAPFDYPTPDGYPEQADPWFGTLLWRWKFALALSRNALRETDVDFSSLKRRAQGEEPLMALFLGRKPTLEEVEACRASGDTLALLLASPAFQKC
ncbi:MAG: DUF1800 domain-containing protein [Verrucomicrobia subdivision 3 bacterium]|nr:DUF1800 domain-containing protein [Limisphaerales bacterium]